MSRLKPFLKWFLYGHLALAAVAVIAHVAWRQSGSDAWQLIMDKEGVQVWERKLPGSTVKQFKAATRIKTTMSRAMAAMKDTDIATCAEWIPGCLEGHTVKPWSDQELHMVHFYRVDFPGPFSSREFLLKTQFTPDLRHNAVSVEFIAMPDALPRNACCVRITNMHNKWHYTQLANNELQVDFLQNMEMGGFLPYFLFNLEVPNAVFHTMSSLPKYMNKDKYDHERIAFIQGS